MSAAETIRTEAFMAPAGTEFVRTTSTGGRQVIKTDDLRAMFLQPPAAPVERGEPDPDIVAEFWADERGDVGATYNKDDVGALARAYLALRAAPQDGPQVTDEMCKAAMREQSAQMGESFDAVWDALESEERAELLDDWRHILTAALTPQPKEGR